MRNKIEIYNYSRRIETILEGIRNSEIDKKNKDAILEFYKDCLSRGLSKARAFKYLYTLENLVIAYARFRSPENLAISPESF